jgi:transposase-like protein
MRRIVIGITSLEQHLQTLSHNREVYRPHSCPHCGFGPIGEHGSYERKADRIGVGEGNLNPIPIPRYLCAGCERTCSRLPECIAPRRWYNWIVQALCLRAVMRGIQPEGDASSSHPALRTIRRWWNWLRKCGPVFRFHLSSRFAELGRLGGELDYWCHVIETMGLSRAMALVNQETRVP